MLESQKSKKATKLLGLTQRTNIPWSSFSISSSVFWGAHPAYQQQDLAKRLEMREIFIKSLSSSGCWLPFNHLGIWKIILFSSFQTRPFSHVYFWRIGGSTPRCGNTTVQTWRWIKGSKNQKFGCVFKKIPSNPKWSIFGRNWWILGGFILSHTQKKISFSLL